MSKYILIFFWKIPLYIFLYLALYYIVKYLYGVEQIGFIGHLFLLGVFIVKRFGFYMSAIYYNSLLDKFLLSSVYIYLLDKFFTSSAYNYYLIIKNKFFGKASQKSAEKPSSYLIRVPGLSFKDKDKYSRKLSKKMHTTTRELQYMNEYLKKADNYLDLDRLEKFCVKLLELIEIHKKHAKHTKNPKFIKFMDFFTYNEKL